MMVTPCSAILRMMAERIVDLGLVEPGIDLVEHQEARPHGEALGQLQALAPRQRQRCRRPVGHVGEAGEGEMLARDGLRLAHAAGVAAEQSARGDVLHHGHLRERLHDLERAGEAEPRNLVRLHARDVVVLEAHAAAVAG